MPDSIIFFQSPRNPFSFDINRIVRTTIAKAQARGLQQKQIAIELGVPDSWISHWKSDESETCIPGDMIPLFCAITGDFSLLDHLLQASGYPNRQEKGPGSDSRA
jgi:transcriptional regulator with XRE-family HTH domain